ncbi:MAG: hypothetical protein K8S97_11785 [Anaerolineae bacterium]|nr:hypothetical protein [Anaerolineae bacterium]
MRRHSATHTLRVMLGHPGPVNGVVFSLDGSFAVSASNDTTLRFWDTDPASPTFTEELHQVRGHTDLAIRPVFNVDGTLLASVGWDGQVVVWGVPVEQPTSKMYQNLHNSVDFVDFWRF